MKLMEINIRDPFVLLYGSRYYMYGSRVGKQTGFDVYISDDLEDWSNPKSVFEAQNGFWGTKDFWAPEVHYYNGKFYMFAGFKAEGKSRGMGILVSDTPDGEFNVHSERITPAEWECLDGTLYVENGVPYMIFCHEWLQVKNSGIYSVRLSEDLKRAVEKPVLMWRAGDAKWISEYEGEGNYVADGPFLYKTPQGELKALWSSFSNGEYVLATACSENGSINGKWETDDDLLYEHDGGHGMIFETKEKEKFIAIHSPNKPFEERPEFIKFNCKYYCTDKQ